jgi:putative transposase
VKIFKAYKFKLRPKNASEASMFRMVGSCRFVWNKLLALNLARLKRGQRVLHWVSMCNLLPKMKEFWPWLAVDPYGHSLQQVCKRLSDAFKRMFSKGTRNSGRKPRFKRKHETCSARFPSALRIEGNRIKIPKIGWVGFRKSREIDGTVKNVTLCKESTGWFVSIQTEREVENPIHSSTSEIGIDVGITRFATFSDGKYIEPINAFKSHRDRLAKAQRLLSRKVKFSSNWKKQKKIVGRIHSKISNVRKDFLHKLSTTISDSQAIVFVEDLKVSNMSRSASGTVENPGKNVKAKSGLNRSILDQGWGMFREMLAYKLAWRGGRLVAVPPAHTSQRCPDCGHVAKENRKSQSEFCCVECGHSANADHVGAINILRAGQAHCGAMELSNA